MKVCDAAYVAYDAKTKRREKLKERSKMITADICPDCGKTLDRIDAAGLKKLLPWKYDWEKRCSEHGILDEGYYAYP